MKANRTSPDGGVRRQSAFRRALLRLAVYWDALRADPRRFLLGLWWRLLGKRLRARLFLAPLIGGSRWAYPLWIAQGGDGAFEGVGDADPHLVIVALIEGGEAEERTQASLAAEGIPFRFVRNGTAPDWSDLAAAPDRETWVMVLSAGDVLAPGAGSIYRAAAARAGLDTQVVYADDDLIDAAGRRHTPHFKPDWNSELYRHFDYVTGAAILRLTKRDFESLLAQEWAATLTMRAIETGSSLGGEPLHISRVLHHRRIRPEPRRPGSAEVLVEGQGPLPSVSVIVPTRNQLELLRTCLEGVGRTAYPAPLDLIVIDNGSDDPRTLDYLRGLEAGPARVLRCPGPFNFSALNNRAVQETRSDLLCFLNNDVEITDPDWLAVLARQALREEVGAVGARLLYPNGRIQHAGVVIGVGGGAAHAHRLLQPHERGYFQRHALPQFVSAVTAACLLVRRNKFLKVGGFDEENFAVAFNDVDLCLRLNERGWKSLYEPRATLIHHESLSRGFDHDTEGAARLAEELAALKRRWGTGAAVDNTGGLVRAVDPYHHPLLSPFSERFVLAL